MELLLDDGAAADISVDFDFGKLVEKLKQASFGVRGGLTMPYGENLEHYPMGYNYGLDVNPNLDGELLGIISMSNLSATFMGMNVAHKDVVADDGIDQSSLTSSGLTLNYNIGFGNFYIQPGVGMLSQEGIGIFGQDYSGSDMIMKLDLGMNLGFASLFHSE